MTTVAAQSPSTQTAYETLYVVAMRNVYRIAAEQHAFTFNHPEPRDAAGCLPSTERRAVLHFDATLDTVCHGFAAYFDCELYPGVRMSIAPSTHSPGMMSWFPAYLPLAQPVRVAAGQRISVCIWRRVDARRVWYEWALLSPTPGPIHNPAGRSYAVGLH